LSILRNGAIYIEYDGKAMGRNWTLGFPSKHSTPEDVSNTTGEPPIAPFQKCLDYSDIFVDYSDISGRGLSGMDSLQSKRTSEPDR
jgi:hypothetical protein